MNVDRKKNRVLEFAAFVGLLYATLVLGLAQAAGNPVLAQLAAGESVNDVAGTQQEALTAYVLSALLPWLPWALASSVVLIVVSLLLRFASAAREWKDEKAETGADNAKRTTMRFVSTLGAAVIIVGVVLSFLHWLTATVNY